MSSGPTAFPLFILFKAFLTSSFLILSTFCSTEFTPSTLFSLSFSSFISSSKYSFHLLCTLSSLVTLDDSVTLINHVVHSVQVQSSVRILGTAVISEKFISSCLALFDDIMQQKAQEEMKSQYLSKVSFVFCKSFKSSQIPKCMDTVDSGVHAYNRQTLIQYRNHAITNLHDDVLKKLCDLGLLRRPGLQSSTSPNVGGLDRRGWVGVRARLKTNPSRPALPCIILSICSLDNKLDYIRLQRTTRPEYRDCCIFVFMETWLSNRVPDAAIQLDGLTTFLANRNAALCAYRPLVRRSKPVLKQVKTWPAGAISALQDCFECTDWNMFRETATNSDSINLEEYTTSVTSYNGKCIDDVTVSKTITTRSKQKPWMTAEVRALLKSRDSAFRAGDKEALRTPRAKLSRAIKEVKRTHAQRIHGHFQDSRDSRRMWQGIQAITNY
ncbi:hypothetical protein QTP70_013025 [Hemibagrus guttatus]|uniref:Uncharacterized protein n=1 Tax=Hemibagrus guttatus TaxID=175788 RepID=A0AAE0VD66_9TELE|nr:hypothetical protein QTP70_013025 [Hemibagrus guttatus]